MNLDELKSEWQSIGDLPLDECVKSSDAPRRRSSSLQKRYWHTCLRQIAIALLGVAMSLCLTATLGAVVYVMIAYFLAIALTNLIFGLRVKRIDLSQMTAVAALTTVSNVILRSMQIRICAIIVACGIIGDIMWQLHILAGGCATVAPLIGAAIGAAIGIRIYRQRSALLRQIKDTLAE